MKWQGRLVTGCLIRLGKARFIIRNEQIVQWANAALTKKIQKTKQTISLCRLLLLKHEEFMVEEWNKIPSFLFNLVEFDVVWLANNKYESLCM